MRPRIPQEPISRLAIWARRTAVFSIPVVLLAIVVVRSSFLEIVPSLAVFGGALFLAFLAIVLAVGAFVVIWREGLRGLGHAVTAVAIGATILAYPSYLAILAYRLPALYDVTTDPIDPPRFEAIARLRSRDANPIAYAGLRAAELQRVAFPNVEPLYLSTTPQEAYDVALAIIAKRKWLVVDARPPQAGRRDGLIEAVARTLILGLREDVLVRVRRDEDGARLDFRSASRYGHFDFGSNAARISSLSDAIDDAAGGDEVPKKPAQRPAKGPSSAKTGQVPARR